jgi:uncharacterized integral membrane protein
VDVSFPSAAYKACLVHHLNAVWKFTFVFKLSRPTSTLVVTCSREDFERGGVIRVRDRLLHLTGLMRKEFVCLLRFAVKSGYFLVCNSAGLKFNSKLLCCDCCHNELH